MDYKDKPEEYFLTREMIDGTEVYFAYHIVADQLMYVIFEDPHDARETTQDMIACGVKVYDDLKEYLDNR